ncbi:MAG TPA: ribosome-associated translation inhibitor RaiA [Verrucomicrobiae bacterium]|jgi:putative sigma-54 modulation protein|nr:ribosome-associated translation inhibitor RaiA [Verrucomicrobiae bacterium]
MTDVKVSVTFRHTAPTDALKKYAEDKVHKVGKYFDRPLEAHVILAVDSRERQVAEVTMQAPGVTLHGREETEDLYAAIDLLMDKIEQQIRKYKTKTRLKRRKAKS